MAKMTLEEWATDQFKTPPSQNTLRKWAREGRIVPAPVKHGRIYYVEADAHYCEPEKPPARVQGGSLLSRIENARYGTKRRNPGSHAAITQLNIDLGRR